MEKVQVGEIQLNILQRGQGTPLLLVHGFPLDHTMWCGQIDSLCDQFHLIAPDLRGFGASANPATPLSMDQLADDLAALLDSLGVKEKITLCGLSMGGYIAWSFWTRHRERLDRLILCDTRAAADSPEVARGRLVAAMRVEQEGSALFVDGMIDKLLAPSTLKDQPELVASLQKTMRKTSPKTIAATLRAMAKRDDMTKQLSRIEVKTLILCGQHDVISPPTEMREIAAAMPRATFVEIPSAGHLAPLESPEKVNQVIEEFLQRD